MTRARNYRTMAEDIVRMAWFVPDMFPLYVSALVHTDEIKELFTRVGNEFPQFVTGGHVSVTSDHLVWLLLLEAEFLEQA